MVEWLLKYKEFIMFMANIYDSNGNLYFSAEFNRIKRNVSNVISLELVSGVVQVPEFGTENYSIVVEDSITSNIIYSGTNLYFKFFDMVANPVDRFQSAVSLQFDIVKPT
jgi:hypothetical protein